MVFENFNFTDLIETPDSMGFYDVALPFLLVFTIFFAILSKLSLFGEKKNINVVIALVFAFLFVRVSSIVELTNEFLPKVSMVAIVLISLLVLIGIFGVNLELKGMPMGVAFFIALIGVGYSFFSSTSFGNSLPTWMEFSAYDRNLFIGIAAIVVFIWFITGTGEGKKSLGDMFKDFGDGIVSGGKK